MLVSGLWVYIDAQTRTGNGCFWGALAFAVPPIGVPLYYIGVLMMHLRDYDSTFRGQRKERESLERDRKKRVAMGDIEKQREEAAQLELGGTIFDPAAGLGVSRQGRQHFTDHNAETLLGEMKYDDAWGYLIELYHIACQENDLRAQDTLRHYISRIPDGLKRLRDEG